jgi:glycosyltransferase involved in cell wall biosynthesis
VRLVLIGPVYPYRGGIAHYTTMLYRVLRERGHDVLLASFKRQYPQRLFPGKSDRDPSEQPVRVEEVHYWIDSLNPITWLMTAWRIRQYWPDVIIMQWWTTFWALAWSVLGTLNRLFLQRPLVMVCHNVLPHEVRWWDTLLARLVLRNTSHFIVQSAEEEQSLLSLLPGARVTIAPLPIFDMFAGACVPREEARRRLDLPPDVPILLFFGIVREYKGLKDLIAALPEVQARMGKVILLVAGEFWEDKRAYLEMIEHLGVGDAVIIDDRYIPNEDVPTYFSVADVLVAPYRQVTGSAVVQLAFGCDCPVITTAVGGLVDLIRDGENGLLVPPSDSAALAASIVRYFTEGLATQLTSSQSRTSHWSTLFDTIETLQDSFNGCL